MVTARFQMTLGALEYFLRVTVFLLVFQVSSYPENTTWYHFLAPEVSHAKASKIVDVLLKVENAHKPCVKLQYYPDPVFINYQLQTEMDPHLELKLYVSLKKQTNQ